MFVVRKVRKKCKLPFRRFFFFSRGSLPIANIVRSRINKNKTYTINENLKLGKNNKLISAPKIYPRMYCDSKI